MAGDHAGNKMAHVKSCHKQQFETLVKERSLQTGSSKRTRTAGDPVVLNGVRMSGRSLQLHCLRLVTEHRMPFSVLDYPAFQDIVRPYVDAFPAREKITVSSNAIPALIPSYADRLRQSIAKEVEGKLVCLMADGCSKSFRHFLGMSIQYIHEGTLVVRVLGVEELFLSHSASNIKAEITRTLDKYKIKIQQILTFTTDNGANYLLAGKLLEQSAKEEFLHENEYLSDMAPAEMPGDYDLCEGSFSVQAVRCAAHTLQLVVEDALSETPELKTIISKVKNQANFLRRETHARELKARKIAIPTLDVETRWGSTYDMINSVVNKKIAEYIASLPRKDQQIHGLSSDEWSEAEDVLATLQPIRLATLELQRKDLMLGDFMGLWLKSKLKLEKMNNRLAKNILKAMEERAKAKSYRDKGRGERQSSLWNYAAFHAAVFMDPRFMSLLSAEEQQAAKTYILDTWNRLERSRSSIGDASEAVDEPLGTSDQNDPFAMHSGDEDDELERLLEQKNKERVSLCTANSKKRNILPLLDDFYRSTQPMSRKNSSQDVLDWWEKQRLLVPELHTLAATILAIPPTQVSQERSFSSLRFLLNPLRYNLHHSNVDDVMIMSANADILTAIAKKEQIKSRSHPASGHEEEASDSLMEEILPSTSMESGSSNNSAL